MVPTLAQHMHRAVISGCCRRGGFARLDVQVLLRLRDQLVRVLDVAAGSVAGGAGVLTRRLQAEVVIEDDYAMGLVQRYVQRPGHETNRVLIQVVEG